MTITNGNSSTKGTSALSLAAAFSVAFFFLGVLIGTLVAMSATSLVNTVIAALFALFGGSLVGLLQKLSTENQLKAALGVFGISLGTLVGVYSGVYVTQHQILTPYNQRLAATATSPAVGNHPFYLRADEAAQSDAIDQQYRNHLITAAEAYEKIHALTNKAAQ